MTVNMKGKNIKKYIAIFGKIKVSYLVLCSFLASKRKITRSILATALQGLDTMSTPAVIIRHAGHWAATSYSVYLNRCKSCSICCCVGRGAGDESRAAAERREEHPEE